MNGRAGAERRELQRRCERALAEAARGAGTRQRVRAAARGFVRRHRRDRGYLAFVLRGVLANSALAVALLGLAPTPAHAHATLFFPGGDPMHGAEIGGFHSAPELADLDADGDADVLAGSFDGVFFYYENTGNADAPSFAPRTGSANPLNGVDLGSRMVPTLADLDADGDLDLVAGVADGTFRYFENTGSPTSVAWVQHTGSASPVDGFDAGYASAPALGDLDGDGDLDLVAGTDNGQFAYFENTGDVNAPAFVQRFGGANPVNGLDVGLNARPDLGDLDRDGDLDLVTGTFNERIDYFENVGSRLAASFVQRLDAANPFDGLPTIEARPALGDLDGDGDLDVLSGENSGRYFYYENQEGTAPLFSFDNPLFGQDVGLNSTPAFGDLDADGDLDMLAGEYFGTFAYFQNQAIVPTRAEFVRLTGSGNPLNGQNVGLFAAPALADLDGDGDLDAIAGEAQGQFRYFRNTGTPASPAFALQTGAANPLGAIDLSFRSAAAFGDLDFDGDLDLLTGENTGVFAYFENTGSVTLPAFVQRTGAQNPMNGFDVGTDARPALKDVDNDADLDVVAGGASGAVLYFENTGTRILAEFVQRTDAANPLDGRDVGIDAAAALADLDHDGDADFLIGEGGGTFVYWENAVVRPVLRYYGPVPPPFIGFDAGIFSTPAAGDLDADGDPDFVASGGFSSGAIQFFENTGSALAPKLVERTGGANPFAGLNAGFTPHLVFADLDRDGDLDLVSGDYASMQFFENTGSAGAPAYVQRTGAANPFAPVILDRSAPAFGDLDADGDLDLVLGNAFGNFFVVANTGDAESPAFDFGGATALPIDIGGFSTPALGDVDRDGDLDLISGDEPNGAFFYLENTGSPTAAAYVQRTGAANPLDGEDVGLNSSPTFADLDGDGDLDLVAGERYGALVPYYLPEPAAPLALGSGAGLLAWLSRLRRRARAR